MRTCFETMLPVDVGGSQDASTKGQQLEALQQQLQLEVEAHVATAEQQVRRPALRSFHVDYSPQAAALSLEAHTQCNSRRHV